MSRELPDEVVIFLNQVGVNWPEIDEDEVANLAGLFRKYAQSVSKNHESATGAVANIAQEYQGQGGQAMLGGWGTLTQSHVDLVITACNAVAVALDVLAKYIYVQKGVAIRGLAKMAKTFFDTVQKLHECLCGPENAETVFRPLAQTLLNGMERTIEQEIQAKVIDAAMGQLFEVIDSLVNNLHWPAPGAKVPPANYLVANPEKMEAQASVLTDLAQELETETDGLISQIERAFA